MILKTDASIEEEEEDEGEEDERGGVRKKLP